MDDAQAAKEELADEIFQQVTCNHAWHAPSCPDCGSYTPTVNELTCSTCEKPIKGDAYCDYCFGSSVDGG